MALERIATAGKTARVERQASVGGRCDSRREGWFQNQRAERTQPRPKGDRSRALLRPAWPLSQNPGKDRSNAPRNTAQLGAEDLHDERECPTETANHLGFPTEPIVLQLTKGPAIDGQSLCCPPARTAAEAPGNVTVPDFVCTYFDCTYVVPFIRQHGLLPSG
jgi:hypothetical protein